jgi:hypothetical protein
MHDVPSLDDEPEEFKTPPDREKWEYLNTIRGFKP